MKLVFRRKLSKEAKWNSHVADFIIRHRLQTKWGHAGVVVDDWLYHATAGKGLTIEPFDPEGWDVYECGPELDSYVVKTFNLKGKVGYDWFSLFAFTPVTYISKLFGSEPRDSSRLYCYEWCYEILTQSTAKKKVVPEDLLQIYIEKFLKKD